MNSIYFKTDKNDQSVAISSSEASELQNQGEELVVNIDKKIEAISFVSSKLKLLVSNSEEIIRTETSREELEEIKKLIERKALIIAFVNGWITKAFNEKKCGEEEIKKLSFKEWIEMMSKEGKFTEDIKTYTEEIESLPSELMWLKKKKEELNLQEPEEPEVAKTINKENRNKNWEIDYLNLNVAELSEFLYTSTLAAWIGKTSHHQSDPIKRAKDEYFTKMTSERINISRDGRDSMIEMFSSSYGKEDVETYFSDIHAMHREAQKHTNSYLFKAKSKIEELDEAENIRYSNELQEYRDQKLQYDQKIEELKDEYLKTVMTPWIQRNFMISQKIFLKMNLKNGRFQRNLELVVLRSLFQIDSWESIMRLMDFCLKIKNNRNVAHSATFFHLKALLMNN